MQKVEELFDESVFSRQGASSDAEDLFIQRIKKENLNKYTEVVDSNRMVATIWRDGRKHNS